MFIPINFPIEIEFEAGKAFVANKMGDKLKQPPPDMWSHFEMFLVNGKSSMYPQPTSFQSQK